VESLGGNRAGLFCYLSNPAGGNTAGCRFEEKPHLSLAVVIAVAATIPISSLFRRCYFRQISRFYGRS
jgi:hypothetical protein